MSDGSFLTGEDFLAKAAAAYFKTQYQVQSIKRNLPVDRKLAWAPTLHFQLHQHLTVVCEASDSPYPAIVALRRGDLANLPLPVAVYCVCPEEEFLKSNQQANVRSLRNHGFGLLTADKNGTITERHSCVPVPQFISDEEFSTEIDSLKKAETGRRLRLAFKTYNNNPGAGVQEVSEIVEGLINQMGDDAVGKGWLTSAQAKPGEVANIIDALSTVNHCNAIKASLGAARGYQAEYRNTSHHFPKSAQQAYKKYRHCRHGFIEGIRRIVSLTQDSRKVGLSGKLPKV